MSTTHSVKMNKSSWQQLAKENEVEFKSKDTVTELVVAIAKSLKIKTTKAEPIESVKEKIIDKINIDTPTNCSKLEVLRKECTELGMSYSEAHTVEDLTQLIDALNGSNFSKPVEINVEGIDNTNIPQAGSSTPQPPAPFNPIGVKSDQSVVMASNVNIEEPTEVDIKNLMIYRDSFTQTIRGHFRLMPLKEVMDLFIQSNYPFTHKVSRNPKDPNDICFILTSGKASVRMPSENKSDWIKING